MAFQWTDKIDGVDMQSASDVNLLARGIKQNETDIANNRVIINEQGKSITSLSMRVEPAEIKADNALLVANRAMNAATDAQQSVANANDVFIAYYSATKYDDILNATKANKVVLLYDGDKFIASLATIEGNDNALVFVAHNVANMTEITEYVCMPSDIWRCDNFNFVSNVTLRETISPENPDFLNAVQACFPDADTMSFPLENAVSEVSAE